MKLLNNESETELNEKDLFRFIFDQNPNPIALINKKGDIIKVNRKFDSIFNLSDSKSIKTLNLFQLISSSQSLLENLSEGKTYEAEISINMESIKSSEDYNVKEKHFHITIKETKSDYFIVYLREITEKNDLKMKYVENELILKMITENSHEGIIILDEDYHIVHTNKALSEILGYSIEKIIGEDFRNFLDEQSKVLLEENNILKQKAERFSKTYEINVIRKSGEPRRIEINSKAINNLKGGMKNIVQITDVTEQRRTEKELQESEDKFKSITEQAFMGILIIQDFKIKYANNRFLDMIGYSSQEIMDWEPGEFTKIIYPDDKERVINMIKKRYTGEIEKIRNYQFRVISKNNRVLWWDLFSKKVLFEGSDADLTSVIDITEQKEAEKKLKESEMKFRNIFEAIPDLFFLVDSDTKILDYRGKPEDFYIPPEEFLGKKLIDLLPSDLSEKAYISIKRTIDKKKPQLIEYSLPLGDEINYYEARVLYYSSNEVAIFIRNISDRKKVEEMIKEEVIRLKELDQLRRDLISRVSHELKTPIMAISGATEYLLEAYKDIMDMEQMHFLKMIDSNKKRLGKLIENLIDISRIDYNKIKLNKKQYNINEIIKEIVNEMDYLSKKRNINLELDISKDVFITIDKIRMEQVIMNLLSNAFKNTPPGGKITIKIQQFPNQVKINFIDTGVGVTEEEKGQLFTKFGKIERYQKGLEFLDISGSGLGLYISREIIKLHNGEISVESEGRDKGANFTISLPFE